MFGITTILASAWRTCKAGKHATALSDSLRRGSFCSGRIVRQTRVEFRPSNPEGSRGFESAPLHQPSAIFGDSPRPASYRNTRLVVDELERVGSFTSRSVLRSHTCGCTSRHLITTPFI